MRSMMNNCTIFLMLLLILFMHSDSHAQLVVIDNVSVYPPNPTTNDVLKVKCTAQYSQSWCPLQKDTLVVNGNIIWGHAIHCVGPLTAICSNVDSFLLGKLPSGTYKFYYLTDQTCTGQLTNGYNVPPQTSIDSVEFTVLETTNIQTTYGNFLLTPNPATTELRLQLSEPLPGGVLQLYTIDGRRAIEPIQITEPNTTISIAHLPAGIYIAHLQSSSGQWQKKLVKY